MSYDFNVEPYEDIHLKKQIRPERDVVFLLLLVLAFFFESFALIGVFYEWYFLAIAFHLVSIIVMATYAQVKQIRGRDSRFVWMTVILMPVFGPMAPAGLMLSLFWHFMSKSKSLSFRAWFESIFPREDKNISEIVYERITFGRDLSGSDYSTTYLIDILKLGNDAQKSEALFKISRYYDPSFAPLLKLAVEDPHNVIRVQAATAMTKIKNSFFSQSLKLERLKREWPEKTEILLWLARHYDNYAFSGLLDEEQEEDNRHVALKYYQQFLDKKPDDELLLAEARQAKARLLLRMGRLQDARTYFIKLKEEDLFTPGMNAWYCECLFAMKRYDELREIARESRNSAMMADPFKYADNVRSTLLLWAHVPEVKVV